VLFVYKYPFQKPRVLQYTYIATGMMGVALAARLRTITLCRTGSQN